MQRLTVQNSDSPIQFSYGGETWADWDRYLIIDGHRAIHIGNACGTCAFFFTRLAEANQSYGPGDLQRELTQGISEVTDSHVNALEGLLPNGTFLFSLRTVCPRLVMPGDKDDYFVNEQLALWNEPAYVDEPHDPGAKYYRAGVYSLGDGIGLFEFIVPMFPETDLDNNRVSEFESRISQDTLPTALAISVLDVKRPAIWEGEGEPELDCHWCLAHYLIDGHHKVFAANNLRKPVSVLSLLATEHGLSGPEEHSRLLEM